MSVVRFTVRNQYGLGRPELYRCDGREDPKEILNGVAVAGLVGILRQLGDLSEFAAEIFQGLHEELISTASRTRKLMSRMRNTEDALPALERKLLAQTSHIHFAYTSGHEWHPRVANEQNHFIYNDLPRFIMDSYEECNDPPSLHLLDKFDTGGPGSCLRRYSDPTYIKRASECRFGVNNKIQRDKKNPKMKKKRLSQRNCDISRLASMSNQRRQLSALSFSRRTSSSQTVSTEDTASKFDQWDNSNSYDSRCGLDPIEVSLNHLVENEDRISNKSSASRLTQHTDTNGSVLSDGQSRVMNDNLAFCPFQEEATHGSCVNWDEKAEILESECQRSVCNDSLEPIAMNIVPDVTDKGEKNISSLGRMNLLSDDIYTAESKTSRNQLDEMEKQVEAKHQVEVESEQEIERQHRIQSKPDMDSEQETEGESEGDIYVDAHYSIELESESERDYPANLVVEQNSSNMKKDRVDCQPYRTEEVVEKDNSSFEDERLDYDACKPESCIQEYRQATLAASNIQTDERISCSLHDMVTSKCNSDEQKKVQVTRRSLELNDSSGSVFGAIADVPSGSNGENAISFTSLSKNGVSISNSSNPSCISGKQYHYESQNEAFHVVQSAKMWTNGGLLGLEPSKPSMFSNSSGPDKIAEYMVDSPIKDCIERAFIRSVENADCPSSDPSSSSDKISHSSAGTDACDGKTGEFQETNELRHESSFHWLTSSPRLEHMKISFNPKDGLKSPKIKCEFPSGILSHESGVSTFPAFQLVPNPEFPLNGTFSESDDETFCRSSAYVSDEYQTEHDSESNSEQWEESDESPEKRDAELYDALHETPTTDSVSGSLSVEGKSKVMLAETEDGRLPNSCKKLQNQIEPALPPLPPVQWRVLRTPSDRFEEKQESLQDELERVLRHRNSLSPGRMEARLAAPNKEVSDACSTPAKSENKVHQKLKRQEDCKQNVVTGKDTDMADFLHQIRTKQFNLRRITATKPSEDNVPKTNPNIHAILEKANSIRQAVATDDGDETDTWSET